MSRPSIIRVTVAARRVCGCAFAVAACLLAASADGAFGRERPEFVRSIGDAGLLSTLNRPMGIAVSPGERPRIYVADTGNARVQVFWANGTVIGQLGRRGTADDEFWKPTDVAVMVEGDRELVYVVDQRHRKVVRFEVTQDCIEGRVACKAITWGGWGTGPGQFQDPTGIAVDRRGRVYVSDWGASQVQAFDAEGSPIRIIGRPGHDAGSLLRPTAVEVAPDGMLWVADRDNYRISTFDPETGASLGTLKLPTAPYRPTGLAMGQRGEFAVLDYEADFARARLRIYNDQRNEVREVILGGQGDERLYPLQGAAMLPNGDVVVTALDAPEWVLLSVPSEGEIKQLANRGHSLQQFELPRGVAWDPQFMVVADTDNHRVMVIDPNQDDRPIAVMGDVNPVVELVEPRAVAVRRYGPGRDDAAIYIADAALNVVYVATPAGDLVARWGSGAPGKEPENFHRPYALAVAPNGEVYVADSGNDRIVRRSPEGIVLGIIGRSGYDPGQLTDPIGVTVGPDGYIYVIERTLGRMQAFSPQGEMVAEWPGPETRVTTPGILWQPVALTSDDRYIYALENEATDNGALSHVRVQFFEPGARKTLDAALVGVFASSMGVANDELWDPRGISASPDGWIAIADTGNNRIQLYHWQPELVPSPTPLPPTAVPPTRTPTTRPTEAPTATATLYMPPPITAAPTESPEPTRDPGGTQPSPTPGSTTVSPSPTLATPHGERRETPVTRHVVLLPILLRR